ncbi:MAG: patatin-like phospholipase family protein [Bacteroidales bacterium]|nr:patatin-like phospholipase family protein [Bacteroidales bacterium]
MRKITNLLLLLLLLATACDKSDDPVVEDEPGNDDTEIFDPGDKKIGLALSGGGAKGAAEIGALKVIEQKGIKIDYISGTSIGSIMGALYSAGYTADELQEFFASLSKDEAKKSSVIRQMVGDLLNAKGVSTFADLTIPFRCVVADAKELKEVVLSEGSVLDAVMASSAIPYIYDNVTIDGHIYVDGGFYNNLPVDVVEAMGAEYTLVVDLRQEGESFVPSEYEPIIKDLIKVPVLAQAALGDATDIVTDYFDHRPDIEKYEANKLKADTYIHPNLKGYNALSFGASNVKEMADIGQRAAEAKLKIEK